MSDRGQQAARRRLPWRAPVFRALLIQLLSFVLVLAFGASALVNITIAHAVLLQGVVAAVLTHLSGMARWWSLIQLLLPPAAAALLLVGLPPWLFLAAFIVLVALYWTTFRTQVPYFPSMPSTWDAVARLLPAQHPVSFIDIGSGFGGLVLELAKRRPDSSFAGIEVAPLPWLFSALRARWAHSRAGFLRGDYERLDFGDYDVVFAYLSPAAMPALWDKARAEMRPGTLLLSLEFPVPGNAPSLTVHPAPGKPQLYGWRF